jgi:hypothetical protein
LLGVPYAFWILTCVYNLLVDYPLITRHMLHKHPPEREKERERQRERDL